MTKSIKKELLEKWDALLEAPGLPKIDNIDKKLVTAQLLENIETGTDAGLIEPLDHPLANIPLTEAAPTTNTSGVKNYDPVLISLIRRSAPKLIAFDLVGVQPMSGPSGQVFYLRSRYDNQSGAEALAIDEANTEHSSIKPTASTPPALGDQHIGTTPTGDPNTYNYVGAMTLSQAEALGTSGSPAWREMSMTIDKVVVEAKSRKLKGEYTHEFAQDLKAIHGLDAVNELSNILAQELTAEINREVIRAVYGVAKIGAQWTATAGVFDVNVDSNGRWSAERWIGLNFGLQLEANEIAKKTKRGKGNIILCSPNVASALAAAKILDSTSAVAMHVDATQSTFAGTIGLMKVYIDPYAEKDFCVVGYKGISSWDAGIYYCPYTPLQQIKSLKDGSLTPVIGFMSRHGLIQNPFGGGKTVNATGALTPNSNEYYRLFSVTNLM